MGQERQDTALALTCLFAILSTIFVGLRTYSRYLGRNFNWDDGLILVSWLLFMGETACVYEYIILSHTGYHASEIPKISIHESVVALRWNFAVQLFYHPLMGCIRASIIMFLFRVQDRRRVIQLMLNTVFWLNIGYLISTFATNIFECTPVRYTYDKPLMDKKVNGKTVLGGKCINSLGFIPASCVLSIFMDLIIIPIPTAMVWNLHMRRKTKVAVVVIMSMGWIATAVSVGRFIVYYYRFQPGHDKTYDIGLVISVAEPGVAIIAACAPALKRLLRHWVPRWFSDNSETYYASSRSRKSSLPHHSREHSRGQGANVLKPKLDQVYGLDDLEADSESLEHIAGMPKVPARSASTKTGLSFTTDEESRSKSWV